MEQRNIAIVQARMGSSRFPGKMLASLGGFTVLEWVLRRLKSSQLLTDIILATTDRHLDDELVSQAKRIGVSVFRGSETDVLGRFLFAASQTKADNVIRVCADNPFIDPLEVDRLIKHFTSAQFDYACNHQDRLNSQYADGFGAEIFSLNTLKTIASKASQASHREHVTLYLWENIDDFTVSSMNAPINQAFPEMSFDIDTPAQLKYLEKLTCLGVNMASTSDEIIKIAKFMEENPKETKRKEFEYQLNSLLARLFPLCRSITGDANRQTLRIIQETIPLDIHEVKTGTKVFDWEIPMEWSIRDAYIKNNRGKKIVDWKNNNIHVVSYSKPINKMLNWSELEIHLHKHDILPCAIPYRTSYYERNWGFCVTHSQYAEIKAEKGLVSVLIDSELKPGSLSYGEYLIRGKSPKEILISTYFCHPSMANDNLSGVVLTAMLAKHISKLKGLKWSYRIIFIPETIGAIAYCSLNENIVKNIDFGMIVTNVGGPGNFSYKQSWNSSHFINSLTEKVLEKTKEDYVVYPFDIHGSDERQFSSPGFRINCISIFKDKYYEYPEYHSSLDNLEFISASSINKSYQIYTNLIDQIENQSIYRRIEPNCEIMLSRHNLYPKLGGKQVHKNTVFKKDDLILWLLFYTDGLNTVDYISKKIGCSVSEVQDGYDLLIEKKLVEHV